MWYILLAVCLIGLVGAFAAIAVFRFRAHDQLEQRIEALRAQGYPMSSAELNGWYRDNYPDYVDNAWPVYVSAFDACVHGGSEGMNRLRGLIGQIRSQRGQSWEPIQLQEAKAYLADNQECLDLLHGAAEIGQCRPLLDFSQGFDMKYPGNGMAPVCGWLLCLASHVAVQEGNIDQAVKAAEAMFALGHALDAPDITMDMHRMGILGMTQPIEDMLSHQLLTKEQIHALEAKLKPIESITNFRQSLIESRCRLLYIFDSSPRYVASFSEVDSKSLSPLSVVLRRALGLHDQDALSLINVTQAHIEAASLPSHKALSRISAIQAEYKQKLGFLTRIGAPAYHLIYQIESRGVARSLCTRVALAVERYRLVTGQLPDRLDSLVPAHMASVPLDPFDGQPLRFRLLDEGYVVYSVGANLSDNGGKERGTRGHSKDEAWDETFIVGAKGAR